MDCSDLKCDIIDECRCYATESESRPFENQICATRRGDKIIPCAPGCCSGGCPGQCKGVRPRQPFRVTDNIFTHFQIDIPAYIKIILVVLLGLVITSTLSLVTR